MQRHTGWGKLQGACLRHDVADGEDPSSAACTAEEAPLSGLHDLAQLLRAPWANAWSLNVVYAQSRSVKRAGYVWIPSCCDCSLSMAIMPSGEIDGTLSHILMPSLTEAHVDDITASVDSVRLPLR